MLTSKRRKQLRAVAQNLKPLIQIGKNGVNGAAIRNIDRALKDHELVKIKFISHREEKKELANTILQRTGATLIDIRGNTLTIYRENA
jgi:RNA-binding protein